jgi:hypothetical protein
MLQEYYPVEEITFIIKFLNFLNSNVLPLIYNRLCTTLIPLPTTKVVSSVPLSVSVGNPHIHNLQTYCGKAFEHE